MTLRKALFILTILLAAAQGLSAQEPGFDGPERSRILNQMREYRQQFISKELNLDKDQRREFFELYDEMDERVQQINRETRDLERTVSEKDDATDTEIDAAATAVYLQKQREAEIEQEYLERFRKILTPRQLLNLRSAERKFTQQLMRQHHKLRNQKKGNH